MKPPLETAVVGGGCFWCVEAVMEGIAGVVSVTSGFAGGTTEAPANWRAGTCTKGHAEVVQIEFDPAIISYTGLLHIFMLMHNPALNRQTTHKSGRYRSIILYNSTAQEQTARSVVTEMQAHFNDPIVTEVDSLKAFYKAEAHHQRYYKNDPAKAYCQSVISPKLSLLRNRFSTYLKPVAAL